MSYLGAGDVCLEDADDAVVVTEGLQADLVGQVGQLADRGDLEGTTLPTPLVRRRVHRARRALGTVRRGGNREGEGVGVRGKEGEEWCLNECVVCVQLCDIICVSVCVWLYDLVCVIV